MRRILVALAALVAVATTLPTSAHAAGSQSVALNVVLTKDLDPAVLADLSRHGTVLDQYPRLRAVTMKVQRDQVGALRSLQYVAAANPDAVRTGKPVATSPFEDTSDGMATWNLDQVGAVENGSPDDERGVAETGEGVYVAVLDSGLTSKWSYYFGEDRVASELGIAFGGGGGDRGTVSTQPGKWAHDQDSHGTHVASTIVGYNHNGTAVGGVAPKAKIIPVKVLNQNGSGWSSVISAGITYVADLKASGRLGSAPVVINLSLGGPQLDAMEKAAIDYAIGQGVVIVASAGNDGTAGMGYPGAYAPVISVAASGWTGQWQPGADGVVRNWWNADDVSDPPVASDAYIADFSGRQLPGQDLDLTAPGSWIVGPYQTNGLAGYYYLSGTSMASPHVAGAAALMLQKNPSMFQAQAEQLLTGTAIPLPGGCRTVLEPEDVTVEVCWETAEDRAEATGSGLLNVPGALKATG